MSSQILGVVGTALVIAGYVPQVFHMVKERCTAGISIPAFALWCSASLLFLIHATMIQDPVFVGVQTVNLVASGFILWFSKKHEGEVCPTHASSTQRVQPPNWGDGTARSSSVVCDVIHSTSRSGPL